MICRDCTRLFSDVMSDRPWEFVKSGPYENLPDFNIHRTLFSRPTCATTCADSLTIYRRHGSLADFARAAGIAKAPYPSFELAARLGNALARSQRRSHRLAMPPCQPIHHPSQAPPTWPCAGS